ncbi:MAG: hypothetical protein LBB61_02510 [Treponema sp.]|jgi:hypothetical protein|nr:hypothetical protein [Treponema sp.]
MIDNLEALSNSILILLQRRPACTFGGEKNAPACCFRVIRGNGRKNHPSFSALAKRSSYRKMTTVSSRPFTRERLPKLLTDPDYARDMDIRSVNGSDARRADVRAGARFRINVEQTGGLTREIR